MSYRKVIKVDEGELCPDLKELFHRIADLLQKAKRSLGLAWYERGPGLLGEFEERLSQWVYWPWSLESLLTDSIFDNVRHQFPPAATNDYENYPNMTIPRSVPDEVPICITTSQHITKDVPIISSERVSLHPTSEFQSDTNGDPASSRVGSPSSALSPGSLHNLDAVNTVPEIQSSSSGCLNLSDDEVPAAESEIASPPPITSTTEAESTPQNVVTLKADEPEPGRKSGMIDPIYLRSIVMF